MSWLVTYRQQVLSEVTQKMEKYPFLSQEWIEKVRELRQSHLKEYGSPAVDIVIKMNQIVTEIPFGTGELRTYIDSSPGFIDIEIGELPDAELTMKIDYETAKAILVNMDVQVAMGAFMAGKIRITGDFTKLLALQGMLSPNDLNPGDITSKIQDLTV